MPHQNLDNSIYKAIPVIEWFNSYNFEKISEVLGSVKMTVKLMPENNTM
jgi:acetylornithine deacetylase